MVIFFNKGINNSLNSSKCYLLLRLIARATDCEGSLEYGYRTHEERVRSGFPAVIVGFVRWEMGTRREGGVCSILGNTFPISCPCLEFCTTSEWKYCLVMLICRDYVYVMKRLCIDVARKYNGGPFLGLSSIFVSDRFRCQLPALWESRSLPAPSNILRTILSILSFSEKPLIPLRPTSFTRLTTSYTHTTAISASRASKTNSE